MTAIVSSAVAPSALAGSLFLRGVSDDPEQLDGQAAGDTA
jgi:hypothetical protein